MKIMSRLIAVILFIFFFFFALRNMQEITLHFLFGYERTDPLVLVLLVCFISGAMFGVLAMTPIVFRHRREASRHKQTIAVLKKEREAQERAQIQPPQPDSVESSQHLV
ncbi:MAG: LapA family protein [Herbaspirillum sp.]